METGQKPEPSISRAALGFKLGGIAQLELAGNGPAAK